VGFQERGAEKEQQPVARTLGDVLQAATAPAPEKDWAALVRAIAGGDQLALRALYAQTHRIVFTLAARITGDGATAEELTLDVFYDVWRRASGYDPAAGSVLGWLMNQARSRAIDRVRFEHRKKRTPDGAAPAPAEPPGSPYEALASSERARVLRQALDVLTPEERQAVEAAFFSELTYREAAARLNEPLGTVKTRIRSGLGKLRRTLGGAGEP
jgi:RNA polymerase sigma-70 factor (ECF subfamily)